MLTVYNQNHDYNQNIHFLHGNSFTPNSYKNLLDGLSNKGIVKTSLLRPLWTKDDLVKFSNWDIFLDDYLDSIKGESNIAYKDNPPELHRGNQVKNAKYYPDPQAVEDQVIIEKLEKII